MANLFKQLNKLKTNIFGGPGNTGFTKPPASRVQDINMLENTPTDTLFQDPLSVSTFSYPMDVQQNFQNGHYIAIGHFFLIFGSSGNLSVFYC